MISSIELKEEPAVTSPETSASVTGTAEAPQTLKKGPWTVAEDGILIAYVKKHGEGNWNAVQKNTGLQRCGKSCRLRWANHLRPNLKKGSFSPDEESLILRLHAQLGNKWARMAAHLPGRTDNEIKNYWNTRIKRRQRAGLPLYPPEIQYQIALMNQKHGTLMLHQNQTRQKNFISHISPTTTLFNNTGTCSNTSNTTNYLLGNFNLSSPPQQLQSPAFSVKMELPSTNFFSNCPGNQKLPPPPTPSMMGQGNNVLFDDLYQESQGPRELFYDGLLFEPSSTSCITTVGPFSPSPQQQIQSNSKHSVINPPFKFGNSNICIGMQVMKQPVETTVSQDVSNQSKLNPTHTTVMPTEKLLSDLCDMSSSMDVNEDDIRAEMQELASTLSMSNDWNFESTSWENMPKIR